MMGGTPDPLEDADATIGLEHVDNAIEAEGDTVIPEEEVDGS